jgi:predicted metal-binding membrane protein
MPVPLAKPLELLRRQGPFHAGLEHGVVRVDCCWAVMLALLALSVGNMFWTRAVAAAIFVETVTAVGARASAPVVLVLLGAAVWIAL